MATTAAKAAVCAQSEVPSVRRVRLLAIVLLPAHILIGAGGSLVLSPGAVSGSSASLNLTLTSAGTQPAGIQWTLTYPSASILSVTGSAAVSATTAGKAISCAAATGTYTCLLVGLNSAVIPDGVVATLNVTLAAGISSATIGLTNTLGATAGGQSLVFTGTGITVAPACTYSISPTSIGAPLSGATGSVLVSTSAGCGWTASSNAAWLSITSGGSGSGNGTVSYSVAANASSQRSANLTIAGQTVTVTQAGLPPSVCIDSPPATGTVSGLVTVAGWAIDNTAFIGTAIGSVQVLVDGVVVGNATYGISRPDVCNAYPARPGCPNVGFAYQWNTAALAPGQHTITISASDTDGTPDTGTASVTVNVAAVPPTVHIDSPAPGSVLSGSTMVSGWALDNTSAIGSPISAVQVQVDGAIVGNASYGTNRPDVCMAYPGRVGCPNIGFSYQLNLASLSIGSHSITVSATDSDGIPDVGSASVPITVAIAPPSVYIDSPAPGAVVSGTVTVAGWALDNTSAVGTAISNLQVKVDGTVVGTVTYGSARPDVCSAYPGRPGCPNVGFTYALNTAAFSPGSHLLTVSASDSDANPDSGSWSITIQVAAPPAVHIDTPASGATVSGMVTVAGWAIDNTTSVGTAISSIQVKVDGVLVGNATYGLSRPDVCAVYAGRPGCPNVGYTYTLNASALVPGTHALTVIATDSDGTPDAGSATITIIR
jgi:hypothetical protein